MSETTVKTHVARILMKLVCATGCRPSSTPTRTGWCRPATNERAARFASVGSAGGAKMPSMPVPEDTLDEAPVVHARGVTKRYRSTVALDGLDVAIGHGITGLLGPNGAGKTTFISLVLGLRPRDAGELNVLGHDPATSGIGVRARIGLAPEHHNLPPDVHAADLVRHLGELHGLPAGSRSSAGTTRSGRSASARSGSARSARCPPASGSA